jgi:predicted nucleic-acid-binding protein
MPAVDTNVLVRLITRDDAKQAAAAEAFVARGAWVSVLALAEAVWVLTSAYALNARRIADAIEMLLDHKHLVLQDRDVVATALAQFRVKPVLGFSDCLLVEIARKAGHEPLGTFDRELAKVPGATRV